jgi:TrmH family RNA methyltransferase
LRSAAAFAATKVLLLGSCAHPFLPRVTRAASGLNLRAPLARSSLPIDAIPHAFALDMQGDNLFEHPLPRDIRLVIGEEGQGIPASFSGSRLRIPTDPIVESLNAAVAASLAMAEYRRRFRLF